jgi:hypothetical protein
LQLEEEKTSISSGANFFFFFQLDPRSVIFVVEEEGTCLSRFFFF